MSRLIRTLLPLSALTALALALTACGAGDSAEKTVAAVGKTKVSQATLSHWMEVVFSGDYQAAVNVAAPAGLVSDPVDYPRCVSVVEGMTPKPNGKSSVSKSALHLRCEQLNAAVKEQALGYILGVLWRIEEGAELGIRPTRGEISKKLNEVIHRQYGAPGQFKQMLAAQRRTVADERFLITRNILQDKFISRVNARTASLHGGDRVKVKLILEINAKLTAKTDCSPGYRAWECKQFGSSKEASPSAAQAIEGLSAG